MTRPSSTERFVSDAELRGYFPTVGAIVDTMRRRVQLGAQLERDDLIAVGRAATWWALQRVDLTVTKAEQRAFVTRRIAGAVLDHQRSVTRAEGWQRTHGRVAHIGWLDQPLLGDGDDITVGDTIPDPCDLQALIEARDDLAYAHRRARAMRPALRAVASNMLADEPLTLADLGRRLGVTESRVCQMAREARLQMRPLAA